MSKSNMTCNDCQETTKPDEFACECNCIDCGTCEDKCNLNMKEEYNDYCRTTINSGC